MFSVWFPLPTDLAVIMLKTLERNSPAMPAKSPWAGLFRTTRQELVPGTPKYWIRVLLAPICLLLVAGLHWYRVEFRDQSPWKGGGFAMFSTVDSPAARTVRCYLLTDFGEVAVEPPKRLEKWISEMRIAPARETMPIIAERLAEATWVRAGYQWRSMSRELEGQQRPERSISSSTTETQSLTALGIGEPLPPAAEIVAIRGVRVEFWRYAYDGSTATIANRKLMEYSQSVTSDEEIQP